MWRVVHQTIVIGEGNNRLETSKLQQFIFIDFPK